MSWKQIQSLTDEEVLEKAISLGNEMKLPSSEDISSQLMKSLNLPDFTVAEFEKTAGPIKELSAKLPGMMKDNLRTLFMVRFTTDEMRELIYAYEVYGDLLEKRALISAEHGMSLVSLLMQAIANDPEKFLGL